MKHAGLLILAAFAAATLFLGQPLAAWATTDELAELRQKNAELEKKISELEALLKQCAEAGKTSSPRITDGKTKGPGAALKPE
jgi:hypothetical protein